MITRTRTLFYKPVSLPLFTRNLLHSVILLGFAGLEATQAEACSVPSNATQVSEGHTSYSDQGSNGSKGNNGAGAFEDGGDGHSGESGKSYYLVNCGELSTGVSATSIGGNGGNGGNNTLGSPGKGGKGGKGGDLTLVNDGKITLIGSNVIGLHAHSEGGDGGKGGSNDTGDGRSGGLGGNGGTVVVDNEGAINVSGTGSRGMYGVSMGGEAGEGGDGGWGEGGSGGDGGNSGTNVSGYNSGTINVAGDNGSGISLLSVGGDGGDGGKTSTLYLAVGGNGGGGGDGGHITGQNQGVINTTGNNAIGISALSIGGGGGHGGDAFSLGAYAGIALGGYGGRGGNAGEVTLSNSAGANIYTAGASATGILAQSIGGGGGHGGAAGAVSVGLNAEGPSLDFTLAMGGSGGVGGTADAVSVSNRGEIITGFGQSVEALYEQAISGETTETGALPGDLASGIVAQSIGGGGGDGGNVFAVAASAGVTSSAAVATGLGGSGASGSSGGAVTVDASYGSISTWGRGASGIVAQSIGGGGGNGGNAMALAVSAGAENSASAAVALGGSGGSGSNGGKVKVATGGSTLTTYNSNATAIVAQSIGGGGGNGGNVLTGSMSLAGKNSATVNLAFGGTGGSGGDGGAVVVDSTDASGASVDSAITTYSSNAAGIVAQSIGGGGGNGGNVFTASLSGAGNDGRAGTFSLGLGGTGGVGGTAGTADVRFQGGLTTWGASSAGVIAQSIGGGGGTGGNVLSINAAASLALTEEATNAQAVNVGLNIGGAGGEGGNGDSANVLLASNSKVQTHGLASTAVLVQSIGGGGGNGGNVMDFSLATSIPGPEELEQSYQDKLDGFLQEQGVILLPEDDDSAGGGEDDGEGGDGEEEDGDDAEPKTNFSLQAVLGGKGSSGGAGGTATVTLQGGAHVGTTNDQSSAIVAQSIGGGGGMGGNADITGLPGFNQKQFHMALGGDGGSGGAGGSVTIAATGNNTYISTLGNQSYGVLAQSIGGGGGMGGDALATTLDTDTLLLPDLSDQYIGFALGGSGDTGGSGGTVSLGESNHALNISTRGVNATGILAQSIGGGGGVGNAAEAAGSFTLSFGGSGGDGGSGGTINLGNYNVSTSGSAALGVVAQSIGGGGGAGGAAALGDTVALTDRSEDYNLKFAFGGTGGNGGNGGNITLDGGKISTTGTSAIAVFAQSIGGGGGLSQVSQASIGRGEIDLDIDNHAHQGGSGSVKVNDASHPFSIRTTGQGAHGMVLQSLSSGGGSVVLDQSIDTTTTDPDTGASSALYNISHSGGTTNSGGGNGGVHVALTGSIQTSGKNAYGIYAQSLANATTVFSPEAPLVYGGTAANNGVNNITVAFLDSGLGGNITTTGENGHGIFSVTNNASGTAQNINVQNDVDVYGTGAWGVVATNGFEGDSAVDSSAKMNVKIDSYGAVSAHDNAAGGLLATNYLHGMNVEVAGYLNYYGTASDGLAARLSSQGTRLHIGGTYEYGAYDIPTPGHVRGNIVVDDLTPGKGKVTLGGYSRFQGSLTSNAGGYDVIGMHFLGVDGGGGGNNEKISLSHGKLTTGGTGRKIVPYLTALPTPDFQPVDIITSNGHSFAYSENLQNWNSLSTSYQYNKSSEAITVTDININYAGAPGYDFGPAMRHAAKLATAQAAAIKDGSTPATPQSPMYRWLLDAANTHSTVELAKDLALISAASHYSSALTLTAGASGAMNHMESCGDAQLASVNPVAQGECTWAKYTYSERKFEQGGLRDRGDGVTFGNQRRINEQWFWGVGAQYEDISQRGNTSLFDGERLILGGILKYVDKPVGNSAFASLTLAAGLSQGEGSRYITVGDENLRADSEHKAWLLMTRLRGGYGFKVTPGFDMTPLVNLNAPVVLAQGYQETGADEFNLKVEDSSNVLPDVHPQLQLGTHFKVGETSARLFAEAGARFPFGDARADYSLPDSFAPDTSATAIYERDDVSVTWGVGAIVDANERLELRLNYKGEQGDSSHSKTFSAKLAYKF